MEIFKRIKHSRGIEKMSCFFGVMHCMKVEGLNGSNSEDTINRNYLNVMLNLRVDPLEQCNTSHYSHIYSQLAVLMR
jgi:hypothetical protein